MIKKIGALLWQTLGWVLWNPIQMIVSAKTDFFGYRRLVRLHWFCNPLMIRENSFYGHSRAVRAAGGSAFGARIEHGVFFAENPATDSEGLFTPLTVKFFKVRRVYTFSERRREIVVRYLAEKGLKMKVFAIGPYISYAKHFLTESKLLLLKRRLGRVLVVYPQHSAETTTYHYDLAAIIEQIQRVKSRYDKVLVSLYWLDILHGMARTYEAAGFTVVCAGRREDPNFLSRQKDLLSLADRVFTNSVGTHVGYAIAMETPCTLFRQKVEAFSNKKDEMQSLDKYRKNTEQFYSVFASEEGGITQEQRDLIKVFWGESISVCA